MRRSFSSLILTTVFLSGLPVQAAVSANTLVCISNYGNKLLSQKKDIEAVAVLEQMFKRKPDYALSRNHLAIAYNNLAVDHPKSDESYAAIHKSLALNLDDAHALEALNWILEEKGIDASTDAARVKYADELKEKGDHFDAFVEYSIANRKTGDASVQRKIDELSTAEDKAQAGSVGSVGAVLLLKKIEVDHSKDAMFGFEYEPYTREINRRVTKFWKPPATMGNRQVQVAFDASPNGSVSNLKIVKSSGDKASDALALSAVKNACPFKPNSSDIPFDVPITMQLDNLGGKEPTYYLNGEAKPDGLKFSTGSELHPLRAPKEVDAKIQAKTDAALNRASVAERSLANLEKQYGAVDPKLCSGLRVAASYYVQACEYKTAEERLIRALAIAQKANSDNERGLVLCDLGSLNYTINRNAEAAAQLKEGLALLESSPSRDNAKLKGEMEIYAKVLYRLNRVADANQIYDKIKTLPQATR